jgi:protein-tyrosine phosphatase
MFNFGPASPDEINVFGAAKPGGTQEDVNRWLEFMTRNGISRVVCLMHQDELGSKVPANLIDTYYSHFDKSNVLHSGISDFQLASQEQAHNISIFLADGCRHYHKTVVHCSAGMGRTGHVLACWLVAGRGHVPNEAINLVKSVKGVSRNPRESGEDIVSLLEECRLMKL